MKRIRLKIKKISIKNTSKFILGYLKFVVTPKKQSDVTLCIGSCGAGKTSYAVRIAQKAMKKGYPVYSNMHIKGVRKLNINDLMKYELGENAIVILDEAASTGLGARGNLYKESNTPQIVEFFTMYRHYEVRKVIVMCPSFADVIPVVRSNANRIILVVKSIFNTFGVGKYKIINKYVDIPLQSEPKELFAFVPFLRGFYFQYATFLQYNSWSKKKLKEKKWLEWE